jgi:outer membrane protein TolC
MMRWNARLAAVALLAAGLAGCGPKCYMTEADMNSCCLNNPNIIPPNLESDPHLSIVPAQGHTPKPMDVNDTNRPSKFISLSEALARALETGNIGSQSPLFPGVVNDSLVAFAGRQVAGSDAVRVLALDPAITGSDIESALARFDARWLTSATWQKTDQAIANGLASFQNGDNATVSSGVYKPLATGGLAGITYNMSYTFLSVPPNFNNTATVNPSYRPQLQFVFEQPLLQFAGVEINQISQAQAGSLLVPGLRASGGTRTEGILITRLRFDQQRAEFERNINYMLLNVEYAYWNLYGAYYTLFSREQGLRYALVSWQVNQTRFTGGRIAIQDLEQTRAQYELFRAQRITALGRVLDAERQLRGLLGMPIEDGYRLVPSDAPILARFTPDWTSAEQETLTLRPEMVLARQDLKFRQLDLIAQKNALKPDLRFFATYDINGLGTRLDGGPDRFAGFTTDQFGNQVPLTEQGNALTSLRENKFNSWELGLRMDIPIGFRDAHAAVRAAQLNLKRSYFQLKDTERKAESFMTLQYRNVTQYYEEMQAQHAQRLANAKQLDARFEAFKAGTTQGGTIDVLLEAQRNWADALNSEYTAITNYQTALAGFQFSKGTLLPYDNIMIAEGQLPQCVQVRAVEHIRERQKGLEMRERPDPAVYDFGIRGNCPPLPETPATMPVIQAAPASTSATSPPTLQYGVPYTPRGEMSTPPPPPPETAPTDLAPPSTLGEAAPLPPPQNVPTVVVPINRPS